jgi:hypothetical protein
MIYKYNLIINVNVPRADLKFLAYAHRVKFPNPLIVGESVQLKDFPSARLRVSHITHSLDNTLVKLGGEENKDFHGSTLTSEIRDYILRRAGNKIPTLYDKSLPEIKLHQLQIEILGDDSTQLYIDFSRDNRESLKKNAKFIYNTIDSRKKNKWEQEQKI